MLVILCEQAFRNVIKSVVTWDYKKHYEAFGYLHGVRDSDRFIVLDASDNPLVYRNARNVSEYPLESQLIKRLEAIAGPIIGDYHSHTPLKDGSAPPEGYSDDDEKSDLAGMLEQPENIYMIVSISACTNNHQWHVRKNGIIAGTIQKQEYSIAAYTLNVELYNEIWKRTGPVTINGLTKEEKENIFLQTPIKCSFLQVLENPRRIITNQTIQPVPSTARRRKLRQAR